ncbi:unnamed protein product [Blumeria hordei]|uniref:DUF7729 domain-containing protein n=1 Tax=Blumeria hordei TaxID=2867405 RepID=A0A383UQA9_BLUHO|nr:unnamed protein product [Blumeria hordei]
MVTGKIIVCHPLDTSSPLSSEVQLLHPKASPNQIHFSTRPTQLEFTAGLVFKVSVISEAWDKPGSKLHRLSCIPGRLPRFFPTLSTRMNDLFVLAYFILFCCAYILPVTAMIHWRHQQHNLLANQFSPESELGQGFSLTQFLAFSDPLLVDSRPAPSDERVVHNQILERPATFDYLYADNHARIALRDLAPASKTPSVPQTAQATPSKTLPGIITTGSTPSTAAWPFPSAFDVGFNNNITAACQSFMHEMLDGSTFKECLPISMLLENSNSFFQTSKHLPRITSLLKASCSAPVTSCSQRFDTYAMNLTSACSTDLAHLNPQIQSGLLGLKSYQTLYTASCQLTTDSLPSDVNTTSTSRIPASSKSSASSFCFANAITNTTNPTDSYIYYLPLNVSLVGSAVPTCNSCLQSTMAVFQKETANRSNVLAGNYVKAASQINVVCGPEFVNASLASAISSADKTAIDGGRIIALCWIWLLIAGLGWLV